jgi:hypothetical protein
MHRLLPSRTGCYLVGPVISAPPALAPPVNQKKCPPPPVNLMSPPLSRVSSHTRLSPPPTCLSLLYLHVGPYVSALSMARITPCGIGEADIAKPLPLERPEASGASWGGRKGGRKGFRGDSGHRRADFYFENRKKTAAIRLKKKTARVSPPGPEGDFLNSASISCA